MKKIFKTKCCKNCTNFIWPDFYGKTRCEKTYNQVDFDDGKNCNNFNMRTFYLPED